MKRLIDAEEYKKEIFEKFPPNKVENRTVRVATELSLKHAPTVLTIPDNATNGDMIMALFPKASITEIGGGQRLLLRTTISLTRLGGTHRIKERKRMSKKKDLCHICEHEEECKVKVTGCNRFEPNEEYKEMCIRQAFDKLAKLKDWDD